MQAPKSLREALHMAMVEAGNLRQQVPGAKVGQVLDTLDRIETSWEKQDREDFPLNSLVMEISVLRGELSETYDSLDSQVGRGSTAFDLIIQLVHRLQIYSESIVLNPVFEGLEKRLERLERVLPPRNYAIKQLLDDVWLDPGAKQRIASAFALFEQERYESAIQECGKANEILFSILKSCLRDAGITELSENTGPALREIRKSLESVKSGRLEHFVVSMAETLHYLRNLAAHERTEERSREQLPGWQIDRREIFTQRPEYARLALTVTVQVALELQVLHQHRRSSS